jgi:hypothetical protein
MRLHKRQGSFGGRVAWIAAGLAVVTVFFGASFIRETLRSRQIDAEIQALQDESERLQAKNFEILSLQSSAGKTEFLEKEGRTKLGLQKEGERVVVLRQGAAPMKDEGLATRSLSGEGWGNPKKWWMYFADRGAFDAYDRNAESTVSSR